MKRLLPIFLLLAACSVQVQPQAQATKEVAQSTRVAETVATLMPQEATPVPTLPPGCEAHCSYPDGCDVVCLRANFLILGIDKAYWRDSDPRRPHTDLMVVASITSGYAPSVTFIQIPRNTYVPLPNIPDDFAFGLYSEGGLGMIEGWVEQALGLPLVGAAAMRMDDFITLVDDQGGLTIGGTHYNGLELLTWTRFDLFERPGYDAQSKHFEVLEALADKFRELVLQNMGLVLNTIDEYSELVETDIDRLSVLGFLFNQGLPLLQGKYSVERVRLEDALCYEDIPFENTATKGLLVCDGINLHEWVQDA